MGEQVRTTEPIKRVRFSETGEIGIYCDDGWLRLIYFDHQGDAVIEFPREAAGALGQALQALSRA